ncbi:hypothetical protein EUTSA_v10010882mg [Eutrema salsugineum]|uniref:Late embryogenesis abundant protein LEA-2 subgroup domain-containing protein n=1 Tax=Eutrema salsugineum TaxID=72664 RepID=V4LYS9_EUTSA|nr:hypothetical protein EUTSA_v10010882mg [Eutrema salsugineum]
MTKLKRKPRGPRGCICCPGSGIILTIIFLIALILAWTVYKPKHPIVLFQSATVQDVASRIPLPFDYPAQLHA